MIHAHVLDQIGMSANVTRFHVRLSVSGRSGVHGARVLLSTHVLLDLQRDRDSVLENQAVIAMGLLKKKSRVIQTSHVRLHPLHRRRLHADFGRPVSVTSNLVHFL